MHGHICQNVVFSLKMRNSKSGDCCSHLLAEPVYIAVVTCTTLVPKEVEGIVWSHMLFDLSIAA